MDTKTIKRLLKQYKCFKGVFPSDRLPYSSKLPLNIIVNTDPSHKPGQHWVSISINKFGRGYYFDSFGLPPMVKDIINFLNKKSSAGWSYNKIQVQNIKSSTCGNYCVLYTIFKCNNMGHKEFMREFGGVTQKNDIKMRKIFKTFLLVKKFLKTKLR
jgi:hypothetical protein